MDLTQLALVAEKVYEARDVTYIATIKQSKSLLELSVLRSELEEFNFRRDFRSLSRRILFLPSAILKMCRPLYRW